MGSCFRRGVHGASWCSFAGSKLSSVAGVLGDMLGCLGVRRIKRTSQHEGFRAEYGSLPYTVQLTMVTASAQVKGSGATLCKRTCCEVSNNGNNPSQSPTTEGTKGAKIQDTLSENTGGRSTRRTPPCSLVTPCRMRHVQIVQLPLLPALAQSNPNIQGKPAPF